MTGLLVLIWSGKYDDRLTPFHSCDDRGQRRRDYSYKGFPRSVSNPDPDNGTTGSLKSPQHQEIFILRDDY